MERLGSEPTDSAVGIGLYFYNPRVAENLEVLRGLGLAEPDPVRDFAHGQGAVAQELNDPHTIGFG